MMTIGLPKETRTDEARVGLNPDAVKKLCKKGYKVLVERSCGVKAGFPDSEFQHAGEGASEGAGVEIVDTKTAYSAEIVVKIHRPTAEEASLLKKDSVLISFLEPHIKDGLIQKLAQAGINAMGMELIPRT